MKIDRNQLLSVGILWRTGIGRGDSMRRRGRTWSVTARRSAALDAAGARGTASDVAPGHGAARRRSGGVASAGEERG